MTINKVIKKLLSGQIGIIPTDTIYGIVGDALNPEVVERIYKLRGRDPKKPFIILISLIDDLKKFDIKLDNSTKEKLSKLWPGKISVIFPCTSKKFAYLHRDQKSLAFRLPKDPKLAQFLKKTGPLVAPSANLEGQTPAKTINDAKKYFGDKVDFYIDGGTLESKPSTLVEIKKGQINILRQGAVKLYD